MPAALPSKAYSGQIWRMVEAQHVVSTLALVDSLDEQIMLEAILERSKPPVPEPCRHLHYLLATPFRYGCYPVNSRFRRRGQTPGVFYGSERVLTAAMENVWALLKFYGASPGTALPKAAAEYSAFSVEVSAKAVDLTKPPLTNAKSWTHPSDYSDCLNLADTARTEGIDAIRYQSVRDPDAGANIAVLTCAAFAQAAPIERQTWRIMLRQNSAVILREWPQQAWEVQVDGSRLTWT